MGRLTFPCSPSLMPAAVSVPGFCLPLPRSVSLFYLARRFLTPPPPPITTNTPPTPPHPSPCLVQGGVRPGELIDQDLFSLPTGAGRSEHALQKVPILPCKSSGCKALKSHFPPRGCRKAMAAASSSIVLMHSHFLKDFLFEFSADEQSVC